MRFRHILSETRAGLRQNLTMTLAVIMTMWVSLSLFGAGLLASQQVDLMKGRWYDKIEISIFLCAKDTRGDQCDPGQDVTQGQKDEIQRTLEGNPEVAQDGIYFETKQGVVSSVVGLRGVQKVQDLHQLLDPFFRALNVLQWSTAGASALLLLASALQIGNTIRLATFARRREIGIMRLVGASNFYITMPFLLGAVISALLGVALACLTMAAGVYFWIIRGVRNSIRFIAWIGWQQTAIAMLGVVAVGLVLAVIPTLVTTRRYLRV